MLYDKHKYVTMIKAKARDLGFMACGIAKACRLDEEASRLEEWLENGMHGTMKYMENHFEKRVDPRKLVDGSKSVISVVHGYLPSVKQQDPEAPVLSKYGYGTDYHFVLKEKLGKLLMFMNESVGQVNGRAFVDSAPVLDRAWAARAGVGWIGKNTNLLVPRSGSFFFIGELIVDIDLPADKPMRDHCGNCTMCIDACPTGAIIEPQKVDSRKCISYLTIEYRDQIPDEFAGKMQNRVFGCDICQDVCPWNQKAVPHQEKLFEPEPGLTEMKAEEWHEMTREVFNRYFKKTAVQRPGYKKIMRTLEFMRGKEGAVP
jgi:epoxyqueuosine reductase